MRIAVNGAAGAMGKRVIAAAVQTEDCDVVAALESPGHPDLGKDAGIVAGVEPLGIAISSELTGTPEVLVDFSVPAATLSRARECAEAGVAVLIGTTGLSAEQRSEIEARVAARVPVLIAPNMSVGVNVLYDLVERAAKVLGHGYDVEVIEAHHRRKKDAPSGTAMELARRLCVALERDPETVLLYGRQGATIRFCSPGRGSGSSSRTGRPAAKSSPGGRSALPGSCRGGRPGSTPCGMCSARLRRECCRCSARHHAGPQHKKRDPSRGVSHAHFDYTGCT